MGHPVWVQKADHHLFQLLHGKVFVILGRMVQLILLDISADTWRQEGFCAIKGQHPPQLGGGNIHRIVPDQQHFVAMSFQQRFCLMDLAELSPDTAAENTDGCIGKDLLRLFPIWEGSKHITAQQQG